MKKESIDIKYLTINDMDTNWGLTVTTVGFQHIDPQTLYPPKIHPSEYYFDPNKGRVLHEYQLVYVIHGEGKFRSSSVRLADIGAGTVFMLFPGEWHSYRPNRHSGWSEYWVGFNGSYMEHLYRMGFFSKADPVFHIGLQEVIVDLFVKIIENARTEKIGFQQLISGATTFILGQIYAIKRTRGFGDKDIENLINRARVMMRENIHRTVSPEEIASSLNIGYSWFRRMFRQYTGLAPAQYQLQLKIQKAKELLMDHTLSVKEIAFQLDFSSHYHFSSIFKQKTGSSPSSFRSMSLMKNPYPGVEIRKFS
jgi:AraC-like DNA-binding protein